MPLMNNALRCEYSVIVHQYLASYTYKDIICDMVLKAGINQYHKI